MSHKRRLILIDSDDRRLDDLLETLTDDAPRWQPLESLDGLYARLGGEIDVIISSDTFTERLLDASDALLPQSSAPPRPQASAYPVAPTRASIPPHSSAPRWRDAFARLAEHHPDGVFLLRIRPTMGFEYINPALSRLTGCVPQTLREDPMQVLELFARRDRHRICLVLDRLATPQILDVELWPRREGRKAIAAMLYLVPVFDKHGEKIAVEGIVRVSPLDLDALSDAFSARKHLTESDAEGFWDWDIEPDRVAFSTGWLERLGHIRGELNGASSRWFEYVHEDDRPRLRAGLQRCLAQDLEGYEEEYRLRCGGGGGYQWVVLRATIQRDREGNPLRLVGTHSHVPERDAWASPVSDPESLLKVLASRAQLTRHCQRLMRKAQRATPFVLVLVSLDRLSIINDALGHGLGDRLLDALARRLRDAVSPGELLARFDLGAFGVVLTSPRDCADPVEAVSRIQQHLEGPFEIEGHELHPSISLGASLHDDPSETDAEALVSKLHRELALEPAQVVFV